MLLIVSLCSPSELKQVDVRFKSVEINRLLRSSKTFSMAAFVNVQLYGALLLLLHYEEFKTRSGRLHLIGSLRVSRAL